MSINFTTWRSLVDGSDYAIPDSVVEDFERDNPLNDWELNTGEWNLETNEPLEGDQSIETGSEARSGSTIRLTSSQTGRMPEIGDTVSFLMITSDIDNTEVWFSIGADETEDDPVGSNAGLTAGFNEGTGDIRVNGNSQDTTALASGDYNDQAVEVELKWLNDGTFSWESFEFAVSSQERGDSIDSLSTTFTDINDGAVLLAGGGSSGANRIADRIWIRETE